MLPPMIPRPLLTTPKTPAHGTAALSHSSSSRWSGLPRAAAGAALTLQLQQVACPTRCIMQHSVPAHTLRWQRRQPHEIEEVVACAGEVVRVSYRGRCIGPTHSATDWQVRDVSVSSAANKLHAIARLLALAAGRSTAQQGMTTRCQYLHLSKEQAYAKSCISARNNQMPILFT